MNVARIFALAGGFVALMATIAIGGSHQQDAPIATANRARAARAAGAFAGVERAMAEGRWRDAYELNVNIGVSVDDVDFPARQRAADTIYAHLKSTDLGLPSF